MILCIYPQIADKIYKLFTFNLSPLFLPNQFIFLSLGMQYLKSLQYHSIDVCITRNDRTITVDFHLFVYIYI